MTEQLALLTVPETAKLLRVNRDTAYRLVHDGAIPSVKLGRSLRIPRELLMAHIDRVAQEAVRAS
jgi:excisionase family DNA binding protein